MKDIRETPEDLARGTVRQQQVARYLGLGFEKVRLPEEVYELMRETLERNAPRFVPEQEIHYIKTDDTRAASSLYYEEHAVNQRVLEALRPMHEAWSGMELVGTACYGIRIYQRGSYLYNHVDRLATHVVSGTICVDSDLEEPWPLYIEDSEGRPHEVAIEPGEMVFFEGSRLKHGRPWPMKGEYYASMFVHYAPPDWDLSQEDVPRDSGETERG